MTRDVRCTNPNCGATSRLGGDVLGRTFRCSHCGTKLPRAECGREAPSPPSPPRRRERPAPPPAPPWEAPEPHVEAGRTLGVALPREIGKYPIRGLVGSDAASTVYRATDPVGGGEVHVRVWNPGVLPDEAAESRFVAEGRSFAQLRSPGLAVVLEADRSGRGVFLATEPVAGRPLPDWAESDSPDFRQIAAIAAAVADALAEVHESDLAHGDLSPNHVIVDDDGKVILAGLRPAVLGESPDGLPYLAPERAAESDAPADPASDQYSLGAVIYELISGRPPFLGEPALLRYYIEHDDPLPPRLIRAGVPAGLERILMRMLAKRPEDRYANCRAAAAALRRWLERGDARPRPAARAVEWVRRRPAAVASSVLALFGLATTALLVAWLGAATTPGEREAPTAGPLLAASRSRDVP